eukprot:TRINITY_DN5933_c1_g1_i1.p1 TRINITY_DN5933_c1_g1~~TRINITY_DN5933_c1_g1_i1.p1  ORF type:complete len:679 (+),score=71.84 TRINITY_DN5933_c1_g1_i1:42-2078(+)
MEDTLTLFSSLALVKHNREREGEVVIYRKGGVYVLSIASDGLTHTSEINGKFTPVPVELRDGEELWFELTMSSGDIVSVYFDDDGIEFYQKYAVCSWLASGSIARMKFVHKPGVGTPLSKTDLLRVTIKGYDIQREGWDFTISERLSEKRQVSLQECCDENSILCEVVGSKKRERVFIVAPSRDAEFEGCTDATLYCIEITKRKHNGVSPVPSDDDDADAAVNPPSYTAAVANGNGSLQLPGGSSFGAVQTEICVTPPAASLPNVSMASNKKDRKRKKDKKDRNSGCDVSDCETDALLPVAMAEGGFPLSILSDRIWPLAVWGILFTKVVFVISHPVASVLRLAGYAALLVLWVKPNSSITHHSLPKEYGPALLGTMWIFLVIQELVSVYKSRAISRTFLASLSHRNKMVNKQCCKPATYHLNSVANYVLLVVTFGHWSASLALSIIHMSKDSSRQISEALLLPLGLLTVYSTLLHFRMVSIVQWSIVADTVPPLDSTAKERFDTAVSQTKGWRGAIECSSAARLLQVEGNKSWGWILFIQLVSCIAAISWGVRLRYERKTDNADLVLMSFLGCSAMFFWLLSGWNQLQRSMLTNFLNHFEWRVSEQASHLRVSFDPASWTPTLTYFSSLSTTPITWRMANMLSLPDMFYAGSMLACAAAFVALLIDIATDKAIFPTG